MRVAVPVVKSGEKIYLVPHFGKAPSFAIVEVEEKNFKILEVFQNRYATLEHRKIHEILREFISRGVQVILTLGIGSGAFYRLREEGIKIFYVTPPQGKATLSLEEALNMFVAGKAEEASEPREADAEHEHHHLS